MNIKAIQNLDSYSRVNIYENYLIESENFSFTSIRLKKKRAIAALLKKLLIFLNVEDNNNSEFLNLSLKILFYFFKSLDSSQEKVEFQLVDILQQLIEQTGNLKLKEHLLQLLEEQKNKKQKHIDTSNLFWIEFFLEKFQVQAKKIQEEQKKEQLKLLKKKQKKINSKQNTNYSFLDQESEQEESDSFQESQEEEDPEEIRQQFEGLKNKMEKTYITVDIIIALANILGKIDTEEAINFVKTYYNSNMVDSFILQKWIFNTIYTSGELLFKEEILEFVQADPYDLEYVDKILKFTSFGLKLHEIKIEEDNDQEQKLEGPTEQEILEQESSVLSLQIIYYILEFSRGSTYIWEKLLYLITHFKDCKLKYFQNIFFQRMHYQHFMKNDINEYEKYFKETTQIADPNSIAHLENVQEYIQHKISVFNELFQQQNTEIQESYIEYFQKLLSEDNKNQGLISQDLQESNYSIKSQKE